MLRIILFAALSVGLMANHVGAAMSEYCQSPPFLSLPAAPNVLMMVDTSGSMGWKAYSYGGTRL